MEFYRILSHHAMGVRYWERGVGETLSSGTGSSAAAVAAILNHQVESPVVVHTQAGELTVRWDREGVFLTGPAEITFEGHLFLKKSTGAGATADKARQTPDRRED